MRNGALVVLLLVVVASMAQSEKDVTSLRNALDKDRPYKVIRRSNALIKKDTSITVLLALRAEAYNMIDDHTRALADASRGVRSTDQAVKHASLVQGGIAYYGLGVLDSAEVWLDRALAGGSDAQASFHLGLVKKSKGDPLAALSHFEASLKSQPDGVQAIRERGSVLALKGDTAGARRDLDRVIELEPRDPVNWNSRGYYCFSLIGDHRRAIADFDQAIRLNPNYGYAFNNRGWSYYKLGDTDRAIKDIRAAGSKNPGNAFVYRNLGVIAMEENDTTGACLQFGEALRFGFTAMYGPEVEELMRANCPTVPTTITPAERPAVQPELPKENAPGGKPPTRSNAP